MTYNVGDRVSYRGDKGTITTIRDENEFFFNISVEFDEGGSATFMEEELEEA